MQRLVILLLLTACTTYVPVSTTSDTRQSIAETVKNLESVENSIKKDISQSLAMRDGLEDHAVIAADDYIRKNQQILEAIQSGRQRLEVCSARLKEMEDESALCSKALTNVSQDLNTANQKISTLSESGGWWARTKAAWKYLGIGSVVGLLLGLFGPVVYDKMGGITGILARIMRGGL